MKSELVLIVSVLFVAIVDPTGVRAQWEQTNGPYGGAVYSLAVSGSNLFAGTGQGVYLSTDNGTSWIPRNAGLPISNVTALSASMETPSRVVYVGTFGNGVYQS